MPPTSLRVYLTLGLALGPVLAALLGWPGLALAVSEPERLWTVGDRAFQDGLFAQSRRMLERLLERYPSDSRAPDATLLLAKAGFDKVANLSGGMLRWRAQRFPVEGGTD